MYQSLHTSLQESPHTQLRNPSLVLPEAKAQPQGRGSEVEPGPQPLNTGLKAGWEKPSQMDSTTSGAAFSPCSGGERRDNGGTHVQIEPETGECTFEKLRDDLTNVRVLQFAHGAL